MRTKDLEQAVGGLSNPTKMPGLSYGIPAAECKVGSLLRKKGKDTVCGKCYAHKGMYSFPVVKKAQYKRLAILSANLEVWRENMTTLLARKYARKQGDAAVFRWHDSGDLQSMAHLEAIVQIAKDLPKISFWLPTKEHALIKAYGKKFPNNLVVRVSAPMIGQGPVFIDGTVSSTVGAATGFQCEAYTRGGVCGDCRACWKKDVKSVDYPLH